MGEQCTSQPVQDREDFFLDNLLVRIHIWWTGLAPWEFEFPFTGSLTSTFLRQSNHQRHETRWTLLQNTSARSLGEVDLRGFTERARVDLEHAC